MRHLERFKLGTSYPVVVDKVKELLNTKPLKGKADLVVDATGVDIAVVDMLWQAELKPIQVTITGGDRVKRCGGFLRVPKRDLETQLEVLLQCGRLMISERLPEAKTLINELLSFKVKITVNANDTYGTWREGIHDDMVLALACAIWWGQRLNEGGGVKVYVL